MIENNKQEPSFDVVVEAVNACQEAKARNPIALRLKDLTDVCEYFLVVSARSDRHAQGIANRIMGDLGKKGLEPDSIEGFETGHWILLDYDNVVVHVFYEPVRGRYDLEGLWGKCQRLEFECEEDKQEVAA